MINMIKYLQKYKRELNVWLRLQHDHILPLYGIANEFLPGITVMVCPWLEHGTVTSFIASRSDLCELHRLQLVGFKSSSLLHHIELFPRLATLLLVSTIVGTHPTEEDRIETKLPKCTRNLLFTVTSLAWVEFRLYCSLPPNEANSQTFLFVQMKGHTSRTSAFL